MLGKYYKNNCNMRSILRLAKIDKKRKPLIPDVLNSNYSFIISLAESTEKQKSRIYILLINVTYNAVKARNRLKWKQAVQFWKRKYGFTIDQPLPDLFLIPLIDQPVCKTLWGVRPEGINNEQNCVCRYNITLILHT